MEPTLGLGGREPSKSMGWQLDKRISIQHLSTVIAMLLAGLAAFNSVSKEVAVNAVRISLSETQSVVLKADIQSTLNELKAEIRDLRNEVKLFQLRTVTQVNNK
jgi:uncharacterized protein YlxW (UPF0749 family)